MDDQIVRAVSDLGKPTLADIAAKLAPVNVLNLSNAVRRLIRLGQLNREVSRDLETGFRVTYAV